MDTASGMFHKILVVLLLACGMASAQNLPESPAPKPKWLDKQTVAQLSVVATSYAYDGLSSQALAGWHRAERAEINPFVGHSRLETGVYFAGAFAATAGTAYMLRRHTRTRWFATGAITALEVFQASRNYAWVKRERQNTNACMNADGGVNAYGRCPR